MAQTQSIKCISCGKTLGVVDISTGDFKTITFNTKWDKVDKIAAKDEKDQNKVIKKAISKAGYKVNKNPKFNLHDATTEYSVTCSCGQANRIY